MIDASRAAVSLTATRVAKPRAFAASALHFGGDLAGSTAVLIGLLAARAGYPEGDAIARSSWRARPCRRGRLIRRNVDVLMDQAPVDEVEAARAPSRSARRGVTLRRLRMRRAAGRHFADVVIGVPPGAAVGQGHAAADAVEEAVERAVPGADVVVHVEPAEAGALGERATAAALRVPGVREVHSVSVLDVDDRTEVSLHLKLPGSLTLAEAHDVAEAVEREILAAVPAADAVQTHIEPLAEPAAITSVPAGALESESRPCAESCGTPPAASRASSASSPPTAAWSPSSRSGWRRSELSPRPTRGRARSRSASAETTPRS